jgi:hypothetical protein
MYTRVPDVRKHKNPANGLIVLIRTGKRISNRPLSVHGIMYKSELLRAAGDAFAAV